MPEGHIFSKQTCWVLMHLICILELYCSNLCKVIGYLRWCTGTPRCKQSELSILCTYIEGSPVDITTRWNMIGRNMPGPQPALSPNSIPLPPSCHCPRRAFKNIIFFFSVCFFKKLHKFEIARCQVAVSCAVPVCHRLYRVTCRSSLLARPSRFILHHLVDVEDSLKRKLIEDV